MVLLKRNAKKRGVLNKMNPWSRKWLSLGNTGSFPARACSRMDSLAWVAHVGIPTRRAASSRVPTSVCATRSDADVADRWPPRWRTMGRAKYGDGWAQPPSTTPRCVPYRESPVSRCVDRVLGGPASWDVSYGKLRLPVPVRVCVRQVVDTTLHTHSDYSYIIIVRFTYFRVFRNIVTSDITIIF